MVNLVFFSTNRSKVAHFRYLGQKIGIDIKSFQEANYYASYHEPRIDNRAELLRQSHQSALAQWRRRTRGMKSDITTFFLEDTSVRIEGLSQDKETPGVYVKFWMRGMTFNRLDTMLKSHGNDRRVTVRSDIVMHLPSKWQELLGVNRNFLWVHGEVEGHVADAECIIQPNLVYPWLDDKTFNRWFVPNGANHPVSALDIYEADKFDFRAKAFKEVEKALRILNLLESPLALSQTQLELPYLASSPSVFVICGPTCAGKTTSASWMTDEYGIPHIEASDFMYKAFWERHGLRSSVHIGDFAEAALKTQPGIVALAIARHIREKSFNRAVVTGFRAPEETVIFRTGLSPGIKTEILFLDAPEHIRLERAIKRGRDDVTAEKFAARNEQEDRMGLPRIAMAHDTRHIDSNRPLPVLFRNLRRQYSALFNSQIEILSDFRSEASLEPLILMTLLDINTSSIWLTTTEIAARLNEKFRQTKSKNNVSRYFNQEYHPYFAVRLRETDGRKTNTVEYQLSPTGISEAKLLLVSDIHQHAPRRPPRKLKSSQYHLPL